MNNHDIVDDDVSYRFRCMNDILNFYIVPKLEQLQSTTHFVQLGKYARTFREYHSMHDIHPTRKDYNTFQVDICVCTCLYFTNKNDKVHARNPFSGYYEYQSIFDFDKPNKYISIPTENLWLMNHQSRRYGTHLIIKTNRPWDFTMYYKFKMRFSFDKTKKSLSAMKHDIKFENLGYNEDEQCYIFKSSEVVCLFSIEDLIRAPHFYFEIPISEIQKHHCFPVIEFSLDIYQEIIL